MYNNFQTNKRVKGERNGAKMSKKNAKRARLRVINSCATLVQIIKVLNYRGAPTARASVRRFCQVCACAWKLLPL